MKARSFGLGGTRRLPATVLVARREVRMRLRSRVFIGGTIVMAVLVVVGIVAASLFAGRTTPVRVGFSGGSQALERTFNASAAALGASVTVSDIADVTAGKAQVTAGTLDVLVTGSSTAPTAVVKVAIPSNVDSALYLASEAARLSEAGLPPAAVSSAMALVPVEVLQPSTPKDTQNLFAGLAVGILLWIALGIYGSQVAQGVVEEKATRIMEILLATIRPSRLLAGKVIGIGLVGLLQLTIVGAAALVAVQVTNVAAIPATPRAGMAATLVTWTATSAAAPTIVSCRRPTSPIPMTLPASRRLGWIVASRISMIRVAFSSSTRWATRSPYWASAMQGTVPRARVANRFSLSWGVLGCRSWTGTR